MVFLCVPLPALLPAWWWCGSAGSILGLEGDCRWPDPPRSVSGVPLMASRETKGSAAGGSGSWISFLSISNVYPTPSASNRAEEPPGL